jgi:hypothetical protein
MTITIRASSDEGLLSIKCAALSSLDPGDVDCNVAVSPLPDRSFDLARHGNC